MTATSRTRDGRRQSARDQGRILLAADDPRVAAYVPALEEAGFTVVGVAGGAKALVALQRARPHVVVADIGLKGIRATEFARKLSEAQDAVPVILAGLEEAT